jgi:heptosyltransferase-2
VAEVDTTHVSTAFHADAELLAGHRAGPREPGYDLAVLLPNSFGSALLAAVAGVPERWGYATDRRGFLLTRAPRVPPDVRGRSQVYYYRAMLAAAGLAIPATPDVSLRCPPEWAASAAHLLSQDETWVGLCPGAHFGGAKRWLPERYAVVADALHARTGARIAILGSASDQAAGQEVVAAMSAPALSLCGQTSLEQLVWVLSRLRLLLTNDSGPMHLAAALGTPLVAVFGSTDWRETAPFGTGHRLVRQDVDCAPCMLRECPIDHRCMTRVDADTVLEAALELLDGTPTGMAS